ncbi:hypothetical protein ACFLU5_15705 [Bacteroidota bacterium]
MRNLYQIAALLLLLPVMFFMACNEDDETPEPLPATVLFNPDIDPFDGIPGDTAATTVSVSAPDGLNALVVTKTVGDDTPTEYARVTPDLEATVLSYEFEYVLVEAEIGETVYFDFDVDHEGADTSPQTITVTTNSPPVRAYTAVLIFAPTVDKKSASFFSTNLGVTFSSDSVLNSTASISPNIDFGYYYGNTDNASLASVASYPALFAQGVDNWNTKNATQFLSTTLTSADFTELATFEDIDVTYDGGTPEGEIVTGLAEGDVLAFSTDALKTGGSKKGVILVKTITGTFNEGNNIEIEVLIQELED